MFSVELNLTADEISQLIAWRNERYPHVKGLDAIILLYLREQLKDPASQIPSTISPGMTLASKILASTSDADGYGGGFRDVR